ncbi:sugar ABC transporter permease [Bosea vestrisii]|uniref:carbohydrate ABC transporter permease n=1 Tax=Bosea vestrisii TaxID=151416 RepID=UPI0024DF49F5|nr:sugar ABC transporter permease [Bosea vestrisii]WID95114.1 sugar ABC transporter permease [Bosea vestrisii]
MLAPLLFVLAALTLLPIAELVVMSLHQISWSEGRSRWDWAGLRNYADLWRDALFHKGLVNTTIFALVAVSLQMTIGLGLALLTSRVARGRGFYRGVLLLPILVPGIVVGAIWKLLYSPDFGAINQIVGLVGIEPRDWLGEGALALPAIIAVNVWHWTPFCFLLLFAGIENLPRDVYEAAEIDGASGWQRFRYVTLPLLMPTIAVTLAFRLITAFKVFDEVYLLTGGGPGTATEVVSFSIYRRFFTEDRAGYGSALAIVTLFLLALAVILAQGAARRRREA